MDTSPVKNLVTLESIAASIEGLGVHMDNIEASIDSLAIATGNEFKRVNVKLDEMSAHLVKLDQDVGILNVKSDGLQNQMDNVVTNYAMRSEHAKLDLRVKKLERKFA